MPCHCWSHMVLRNLVVGAHRDAGANGLRAAHRVSEGGLYEKQRAYFLPYLAFSFS